MPKILATKEDWIKLGFTKFTDKGLHGIVVEEMAKSLKVNKSSFYHHFKTKSDFISNLIDFWIEFDTNLIIQEIEGLTDPKSKFKKLIQLTFKKDNHLDFNFYLKKYAANNKNIQKKIDEVDRSRIHFVASLLNDLGYSKKEAKQKADLFYKYLIGYHELNRYRPMPKAYVAKVIKEISHFITIHN